MDSFFIESFQFSKKNLIYLNIKIKIKKLFFCLKQKILKNSAIQIRKTYLCLRKRRKIEQ